MAVIFYLVGIFRYLLSDSFVETVTEFADPFQSFLRWGYCSAYAIIPISVFFDSRLFRNIASYFTLPVALISAICFEDTFAYFMADGSEGYYLVPWFRYTYYIIELVLAISIPALMQLHTKHVINFKSKEEIFNILLALPCIHIQMLPAYMLRTLVKDPDISTGMFGELHLTWIIFIAIECILLHFYFRKRTMQDKYLLLVFLVLAQVTYSNSPFLRGFTLHRLPLQLCSIAAFFYLYTIITKNKKMFDFCYLANIVGAVIAILLASFGSEVLSFWNIHYIYEHTFVMLFPILGMSLGIFPHLDRSALKHMAKYFTIYFVCALIGGTIINGLDTTPDFYPVNWFYMFDMNRALDYVPFVGFAGTVHWNFNGFEVYPILVTLIYIIFMFLNVLFYFFTQGCYKLTAFIKSRIPQPKAIEFEEVTDINKFLSTK